MRWKISGLAFLVGMVPALGSSDVLPYEDGMRLMRDKTCLGCHQVDRRRVGPSFVDIADRYAADREIAIPMLVQSIRQGNRGKWGAIPMPAQPHVTEQEGLDMALFILSLQQKPD
jgi:cytochrome c